MGIKVVRRDHLKKELECDVRSLGVQKGEADVVENLGLGEPTGRIFGALRRRAGHNVTTWTCCLKSVQCVLEIVDSKVGLLHVLVDAAEVVVVVGEDPVTGRLHSSVQHFYGFSKVATLKFDVGADKLAGDADRTRQADRLELLF